MGKYSLEEIQRRFERSRNFNEIFDAFEDAMQQGIGDMELYRRLFWNNSLSAEELCLFGEKLTKEMPTLAYETYMWLANVFTITRAPDDNFELAVQYFKRAASSKKDDLEPYLDAADCYNPDLNIPYAHVLIDFLRQGTENVANPRPLYHRIALLYELSGNDEMSKFYRRKAGGGSASPGTIPPLK
jgi:hypothetical protein